MRQAEFEELRRRYQFACGYCGVTEISVGSTLTIDHYQPRSRGGGDELDNLVYACQRCNLNKHDFWPSPEDLIHQRRILHPLLDDGTQHLCFNPQTGRFHIILLRLNRSQLVKQRLAQ
jgi:5-methylcytosine-specific restriction endonuclease McrA